MKNPKDIAIKIFKENVYLTSNKKTLLRNCLTQITKEVGCSRDASETLYKYAAEECAKIGIVNEVKYHEKTKRGHVRITGADDSNCYTVLEVIKNKHVGRTYSYDGLGLARIKLKRAKIRDPNAKWKLIKGLGPLSGEMFILEDNEKVISE